MDRLHYHILLEEAGIYEKRMLKDDETYDPDSDFIYRNTIDKKVYEIIPNELTSEELQTMLMAKNNELLRSINTNVSILLVIIAISILIAFIFIIRM